VIEKLPPSVIRLGGRVERALPFLSPAIRRTVRSRQVSDGLIAHGEGEGLRINPGGANPGYALGTTEPGVQQALAELLEPGMTFYDVGANMGFFSLIAWRRVGPHGRVRSFEPLPESARTLRHNVALNRALTRVAPGQLALRKRLSAAREYFAAELARPNPQLQDAWYPYLIAFGLDSEMDHWFRRHGPASATGTSASDTVGHGSSSHGGGSAPAWSGGGGAFGGGGASGAWTAAAGAMAAGVTLSSSGGSGGGGGSSGGGGGGGW